MLLLPIAEKRGLFLQRSRPGLVFLSSPLFFDFGFFFCLFSFLSFFPLVGDVALPHQAQRNRSLQQFLAFGGLSMVLRFVQ